MDQIRDELTETKLQFAAVLEQINFTNLQNQLQIMQKDSERPEFWQDSQAAQLHMQQQSKLETKLAPWRQLNEDLHEIAELAELDDPEILSEITKQYTIWQDKYANVRKFLRFSGPYDDND